MTTPPTPDLLPCDTFDAADASDLAKLAALTGTGDLTPGDLLRTLQAVHAELLRRKNSHRLLVLDLTDLHQAEALFSDLGPAGDQARRIGRRIAEDGHMVGVLVVADYGPNELPDDDSDDTQGATSSAKTPAAPCHPAPISEHEVTSS
ncbi:hypothetical protein [Microbispora amethystogenes]|uniref:STAS domain-containing protein n=1 Tax=Microbispora amethystogenes TaxID=1427754 RepID=A0ABQ4FPU2_9ACTN|nr:hypothetical protein [Microbispora amethystogenes]GIH36833.1 hypothetical protein Mam01_69970 [Microbispora amethystogenes]